MAGNNATNAGPNCSGTLSSQGHNLIQNATGCAITGDLTGNFTGQDPLLGPLQDNGGPTFTHALLPGSAAVDVIPAADCTDSEGNPVGTAQRGIARPQGVVCDIGAFEVETATPTAILAFVKVQKSAVGGVDGLFGTRSVTVSPDGKHLYIAGERDHAVEVFSVAGAN